MATNNNFNFDKYNKLMKGVGIGLKLHLAVQLFKDVQSGLDYFQNPLAQEASGVFADLRDFQVMYKDAAAKVVANRGGNTETREGLGHQITLLQRKLDAIARDPAKSGTPDIDNSTVPVLGMSDMMAMFEQFTKMQAALKAGEHVAAQNAQTSIEQIADGVPHVQGDQVAA